MRVEPHPQLVIEWRARAANNISAAYVGIGQYGEALKWARIALQEEPDRGVRHVQLALCAGLAGQLALADSILSALLDVTDLEDLSDPVVAALIYERQLHDLPLQSIQTLTHRLSEIGHLDRNDLS